MDFNNMLDFNNKAEQILNDYDNNLVLQNQNEILNSEIINNNFKAIENFLNKIYEETREINDLIICANTYIDSEIKKSIKSCKSLLNQIEKLNEDLYSESKNYININVELKDNNYNGSLIDRDGTDLEKCNIYGNMISLSGTINNNINIKSMSVKRTEQKYESNEEEFIDKKPYRVTYMMDAIYKNGIDELVTIDFDKTEKINFTNISLSNCDLLSTAYVYENGTKNVLDDINNKILSLENIKSIEFKIKSKNYDLKTFEIEDTEKDSFNNSNKKIEEYNDELKSKDEEYYKKEYKNKLNEDIKNMYMEEE